MTNPPEGQDGAQPPASPPTPQRLSNTTTTVFERTTPTRKKSNLGQTKQTETIIVQQATTPDREVRRQAKSTGAPTIGAKKAGQQPQARKPAVPIAPIFLAKGTASATTTSDSSSDDGVVECTGTRQSAPRSKESLEYEKQFEDEGYVSDGTLVGDYAPYGTDPVKARAFQVPARSDEDKSEAGSESSAASSDDDGDDEGSDSDTTAPRSGTPAQPDVARTKNLQLAYLKLRADERNKLEAWTAFLEEVKVAQMEMDSTQRKLLSPMLRKCRAALKRIQKLRQIEYATRKKRFDPKAKTTTQEKKKLTTSFGEHARQREEKVAETTTLFRSLRTMLDSFEEDSDKDEDTDPDDMDLETPRPLREEGKEEEEANKDGGTTAPDKEDEEDDDEEIEGTDKDDRAPTPTAPKPLLRGMLGMSYAQAVNNYKPAFDRAPSLEETEKHPEKWGAYISHLAGEKVNRSSFLRLLIKLEYTSLPASTFKTSETKEKSVLRFVGRYLCELERRTDAKLVVSRYHAEREAPPFRQPKHFASKLSQLSLGQAKKYFPQFREEPRGTNDSIWFDMLLLFDEQPELVLQEMFAMSKSGGWPIRATPKEIQDAESTVECGFGIYTHRLLSRTMVQQLISELAGVQVTVKNKKLQKPTSNKRLQSLDWGSSFHSKVDLGFDDEEMPFADTFFCRPTDQDRVQLTLEKAFSSSGHPALQGRKIIFCPHFSRLNSKEERKFFKLAVQRQRIFTNTCGLIRHMGILNHDLDITTKEGKTVNLQSVVETIPRRGSKDVFLFVRSERIEAEPGVSGFVTIPEDTQEGMDMVDALLPYCRHRFGDNALAWFTQQEIDRRSGETWDPVNETVTGTHRSSRLTRLQRDIQCWEMFDDDAPADGQANPDGPRLVDVTPLQNPRLPGVGRETDAEMGSLRGNRANPGEEASLTGLVAGAAAARGQTQSTGSPLGESETERLNALERWCRQESSSLGRPFDDDTISLASSKKERLAILEELVYDLVAEKHEIESVGKPAWERQKAATARVAIGPADRQQQTREGHETPGGRGGRGGGGGGNGGRGRGGRTQSPRNPTPPAVRLPTATPSPNPTGPNRTSTPEGTHRPHKDDTSPIKETSVPPQSTKESTGEPMETGNSTPLNQRDKNTSKQDNTTATNLTPHNAQTPKTYFHFRRTSRDFTLCCRREPGGAPHLSWSVQ